MQGQQYSFIVQDRSQKGRRRPELRGVTEVRQRDDCLVVAGCSVKKCASNAQKRGHTARLSGALRRRRNMDKRCSDRRLPDAIGYFQL
jgi:hypothetical protein